MWGCVNKYVGKHVTECSRDYTWWWANNYQLLPKTTATQSMNVLPRECLMWSSWGKREIMAKKNVLYRGRWLVSNSIQYVVQQYNKMGKQPYFLYPLLGLILWLWNPLFHHILCKYNLIKFVVGGRERIAYSLVPRKVFMCFQNGLNRIN